MPPNPKTTDGTMQKRLASFLEDHSQKLVRPESTASDEVIRTSLRLEDWVMLNSVLTEILSQEARIADLEKDHQTLREVIWAARLVMAEEPKNDQAVAGIDAILSTLRV